jgi:hypothetical protein
MGANAFGFEMNVESGELAWTYPKLAPDVTDEQARTLAIMTLAAAIKQLADATQNLAERRDDDG